jgi:HAD superfamily hydrolase (TIGR01459 family)
MANVPRILSGLREIAPDHDALISDVWGVLHEGTHAKPAATEALARFRAEFGPVVLLSNAPRPVSAVVEQFAKLGVPKTCYDAIVTSGEAARTDLAIRAGASRLAIFHLGPERDRGLFEGLPVDCVEVAEAKVVLCTGLFDDDVETPDDYGDMLDAFKARDLVLLCANPDILVQRGSELVYCAGAIARAYEALGGSTVYYGKPHAPIYRDVIAAARRAAGREIARPLAIGDGLETDIKGANNVDIEALFIADGVHGEEIGDASPERLGQLFSETGIWPAAAMRTLLW